MVVGDASFETKKKNSCVRSQRTYFSLKFGQAVVHFGGLDAGLIKVSHAGGRHNKRP
jgi:hypothetical protein